MLSLSMSLSLRGNYGTRQYKYIRADQRGQWGPVDLFIDCDRDHARCGRQTAYPCIFTKPSGTERTPAYRVLPAQALIVLGAGPLEVIGASHEEGGMYFLRRLFEERRLALCAFLPFHADESFEIFQKYSDFRGRKELLEPAFSVKTKNKPCAQIIFNCIHISYLLHAIHGKWGERGEERVFWANNTARRPGWRADVSK